MKVTLEREEVLACVLALEKRQKKIGEWAKSALEKLDKSLRSNPKEGNED